MNLPSDSGGNLAVQRKKPDWLKCPLPAGDNYFRLKRRLSERSLPTICQSARCPNIAECWDHGHATFLAMGDVCTRNCRFCAVNKGIPSIPDPDEDHKILEMVRLMGLKYLVVTSVTRDDLADKGSTHLSQIIRTLKREEPALILEILIPDFQGETRFLDSIIDENPDVLSHNIEIVKQLYAAVSRPEDHYARSLRVLAYAKSRGMITKSGIMFGLGESASQIRECFSDLRHAGVKLLTIGQYLQPKPESLQVKKYYTPNEFEHWQKIAIESGFIGVMSGPFVRSSYQAEKLYRTVKNEISCI